MASVISASTTSATALNMSADTTGVLQLATGATPTTAVTIDTSQNVGIGTSSPNFNSSSGTVCHINNSTASAWAINHYTNGTTGSSAADGFIVGSLGADAYLFNYEASPMIFATSSAERMRITSGGEVYIAGTTDQGAYNLQCNGTGVWGAGAYVNGSDARIKENIVSIDSGLDVVNKLNPVTYKYKEDWSKDQSIQTGFIAQDLLVALEGKNYVDGIVQQGGEYMSVAYQNIIPILTKAIQEQQTIINDLKARIETLEGAKL